MSRRPKKYHYIYKTTCKVTGKFYVGMHSTNNLDDGYLGSGKILGYSRHKYGDENHVKEIVEFLPSRDALKLREKEIVNEELLSDPLNIYLKYGGEGGWDHKPGVNILLQKFDLKERSAKAARTRAMRSENLQYAQALSAKLSASHKGQQAWLNKTHTADTKAKMSASMRGRHDKENNPQFGKCWVTNGAAAVMVKKEQLPEYLSSGYVLGRKIMPV